MKIFNNRVIKEFVVSLIIISSSLQLFAGDNQSIIAQANDAYSEGNYEEAIGLY